MNTQIKRQLATLMIGAVLASTPSVLHAQDHSGTSHKPSDRQEQPSARVTRATNLLGMDVMSADGHRIGEISDYYFDATSTPHLRYVLINSGGFLGFGGDTRAVPADAVKRNGEVARLSIDRDAYWDVAVMPMDRARFLRSEKTRDELIQQFDLKPSNKKENGTLISFAELRNADAYDSEGERVGRIVDTWVSLDQNRAPYVEISSPPDSPFEVTPRTRYAVPLKRIQTASENGSLDGFRFSLKEEEIRSSRSISETDGVRMLNSGEMGDVVLRVRLASN